MPIISSSVIEDSAQRDGRRSVRERHTDHTGQDYDIVYLAEAGADTSAPLAARATQITADLAAGELDADEQQAFNQGSPTFVWTTVAAFRARLRARFQTAGGWDAARLGKFINSQGLSDTQLQALFGVGAGAQLTALKTRLANLASHYDTVVADTGQ